MTAISGTRRGIKELVDGTLRVTIDIEPGQKKLFHQLFPEIDTPVAIAALKIPGTEIPVEQSCGERCKWAIDFCTREDVWNYFTMNGYIVENAYTCGKALKNWLGIHSRKELDTNEDKWIKLKTLAHELNAAQKK